VVVPVDEEDSEIATAINFPVPSFFEVVVGSEEVTGSISWTKFVDGYSESYFESKASTVKGFGIKIIHRSSTCL
jgi:hypothetical protein